MLQHGQAMELHIQVNHVVSFVRAPTEWIALNKALANAKVAQPRSAQYRLLILRSVEADDMMRSCDV